MHSGCSGISILKQTNITVFSSISKAVDSQKIIISMFVSILTNSGLLRHTSKYMSNALLTFTKLTQRMSDCLFLNYLLAYNYMGNIFNELSFIIRYILNISHCHKKSSYRFLILPLPFSCRKMIILFQFFFLIY